MGAPAAPTRRGRSAGGTSEGPCAPANGRAPPLLAVPPKLAMSLLKERELRERLRAYHLPTTGKRAVRPAAQSPSHELAHLLLL